MKNQTGIISNIRYVDAGDGKMCEVKVEVDSRDTNWLPKLGVVGKSFKMHVPPRVGDQVVVHNENGKHEDGYVTDNIAFEKVPNHKDIGENKIIMWAEDETIYVHELKKKVSLTTPCEVMVHAKNKITLKSDDKIILDAPVECTKGLKVQEDIEGQANIKVIGYVQDYIGKLSNFTTSNEGTRVS